MSKSRKSKRDNTEDKLEATTIYLKPEIRKLMKKLAIDLDTTMNEIITRALLEQWSREIEEAERNRDSNKAA